MRNIILGLFVAIGFSSCDLNDPQDDYKNCGNYENTAFASYPVECNYTIKTMPTTSGVIAVKTQEKMDSFFKKNETSCGDATIPTAIDFTKNYLIGIFAGTKATNGYEIKVTSILENECEVVVQFYENEPTAGSENGQALNNPHHFVLIPKTDKPIYFNKVTPAKNYVVLGTYFGNCETNCQTFYSETDLNIKAFLNFEYGKYDMSKYNFKSLTKKGEFTAFAKTVPAEIIALSGKTKTYGTPDSADQGGIYFEFHNEGKITTVYFDTNTTEDQSAEIIAFKKTVLDRIASYKISPLQ